MEGCVAVAPPTPVEVVPAAGVAGLGRGGATIEPIPAGVRIPPLSDGITIFLEAAGVAAPDPLAPALLTPELPALTPPAPVAPEPPFKPVVPTELPGVTGRGVLATVVAEEEEVVPPPPAVEGAAARWAVFVSARCNGYEKPVPGILEAGWAVPLSPLPAVPLDAVPEAGFAAVVVLATPEVDLTAGTPVPAPDVPAAFALEVAVVVATTVVGLGGNLLFGAATLSDVAPLVPVPLALFTALGPAVSLVSDVGYFTGGPCPGVNSVAAGAAPGVYRSGCSGCGGRIGRAGSPPPAVAGASPEAFSGESPEPSPASFDSAVSASRKLGSFSDRTSAARCFTA